MTTSTRVSLADLADATGIVPDLLAAEVTAIQRASVASVEPLHARVALLAQHESASRGGGGGVLEPMRA
jgi:hypothetical protein